MLFDLRSRGRRRTVQFVYIGLAVLMGGGLVLFGVGTGSGNGGLLNAFTGGGGGGNAQNSAITQQEKAALRQTQQQPNNAAAWANLINARWAAANTDSEQTTTGTVFTSRGKTELAQTAAAWRHYSALTKKPDPDISILAARAYGYLGQYANEANTWEAEAQANPTEAKGFSCLALSAYAAKQSRKGDLAKAKALQLTPKASRKQLSTTIDTAKTQPTAAQQC